VETGASRPGLKEVPPLRELRAQALIIANRERGRKLGVEFTAVDPRIPQRGPRPHSQPRTTDFTDDADKTDKKDIQGSSGLQAG
jgi:hypothetical protein